MSLDIHQLTKTYGQQKAVDDVSFSVKEGEIVGFLGPNGAGKSTTMKIITGYLPPTAGTVLVGGVDVTQNPIRVKQNIGYLPEHNPLYLDLYVHEYLEFVGKTYELRGADLRGRIRETIALCGLAREQNKKLESLSKGYRQRVGLAQALIHDPAVLILDEPTTGLDPNQIIEIRNVIKEISKNKTVLFSTHIMQEVQALCHRVIVINKGRIVADDSLDTLLRQRSQGNALVVEWKEEIPLELVRAIPGVEMVEPLSGTRIRIISDAGVDLRNEVFQFIAANKLSLIELKAEETTMENIFKELTMEEGK
ncbi:MAG: gliding motility-associated ABC transporter ATP-binding subunit GldA [Cyclobacteriaceae bacterium]